VVATAISSVGQHRSHTLDRQTPPSDITEAIFLPFSRPAHLALLRLLAYAERHQVAAAPLVRQLAMESRRKDARPLLRIASAMESGKPTLESLQAEASWLGHRALLALSLAAELLSLQEACRRAVEGSVAIDDRGDEQARSGVDLWRSGFELVMLAGVLTYVSGFYMVFVRPTLEKIARDTDASQFLAPRVEILVVVPRAPFYIFVVFLAGFIALLCRRVQVRRRPWLPMFRRRPVSDELSDFWGVLLQDPPDSLSWGLRRLATAHPCTALRFRLQQVVNQIETGADVWTAMSEQQLIPARRAEAIRAAPDEPTRRWLIQQSAAFHRRRAISRYELVVRLMFRGLTLLVAGFVAWLALDVFSMLYGAVEALSQP